MNVRRGQVRALACHACGSECMVCGVCACANTVHALIFASGVLMPCTEAEETKGEARTAQKTSLCACRQSFLSARHDVRNFRDTKMNLLLPCLFLLSIFSFALISTTQLSHRTHNNNNNHVCPKVFPTLHTTLSCPTANHLATYVTQIRRLHNTCCRIILFRFVSPQCHCTFFSFCSLSHCTERGYVDQPLKGAVNPHSGPSSGLCTLQHTFGTHFFLHYYFCCHSLSFPFPFVFLHLFLCTHRRFSSS